MNGLSRCTRASVVSILIAMGLATFGREARASSDTERAAVIFRQAQEAFGRKSYSAAAASFEEAALLAPHAAAWLDAGESWELGGNFARAAEDCDRALAVREISSALRREAETRLARLERQIGTLDVRSQEPLVVTLDGGARSRRRPRSVFHRESTRSWCSIGPVRKRARSTSTCRAARPS